MPYALAASDGELLAGMSDGRILRSADRGETWDDLGLALDGVIAMVATG
jgi:hypothetical protein